MAVKSDIEIAQEATLMHIRDVASKIGIVEDDLEYYCKYKAKLSEEYLKKAENNKRGKLILVTAINPTPAGEGKTTTSVGLGDALNRLGYKTVIASAWVVLTLRPWASTHPTTSPGLKSSWHKWVFS